MNIETNKLGRKVMTKQELNDSFRLHAIHCSDNIIKNRTHNQNLSVNKETITAAKAAKKFYVQKKTTKLVLRTRISIKSRVH